MIDGFRRLVSAEEMVGEVLKYNEGGSVILKRFRKDKIQFQNI